MEIVEALLRRLPPATFQPGAGEERQRAALALAIASEREPPSRRAQQRGRRALVAVSPPHRGDSHQGLAAPHRVPLGVKGGQRALETLARRSPPAQAVLRERREDLRLGALVGEAEPGAAVDRDLGFGERFLVHSHPEEVLWTVESREGECGGVAAG